MILRRQLCCHMVAFCKCLRWRLCSDTIHKQLICSSRPPSCTLTTAGLCQISAQCLLHIMPSAVAASAKLDCSSLTHLCLALNIRHLQEAVSRLESCQSCPTIGSKVKLPSCCSCQLHSCEPVTSARDHVCFRPIVIAIQ